MQVENETIYLGKVKRIAKRLEISSKIFNLILLKGWLSSLRKMMGNVAFVSQVEPKRFEEAQDDENRMMAIQEELQQVERNNARN